VTAADLQADLAELERTLTSIEAVLDPTAKRAEIAELSEQVSAPDLWDDQENAQRITSKSFGKERPVAICNDISCWSQNRRAVTVVQ
jgi:hypothetical protein